MSNIADASMRRTKALPAAGATAVTASNDLGAPNVGPIGASLEVWISMPVTPVLVDTETLTCRLQDSADDVTFVDVETVGNMVVTGANSPGADAKAFRFWLPKHTRRYIRVAVDASAGAGDNTGVDFELNFYV